MYRANNSGMAEVYNGHNGERTFHFYKVLKNFVEKEETILLTRSTVWVNTTMYFTIKNIFHTAWTFRGLDHKCLDILLCSH